MRLLVVLVFALFVSVQAMSLTAQSDAPNITLPDIPDISSDNTFYYFRILTAFVGSRKVLNDNNQPITVSFALKLTIDGKHITVVIRNADNYHSCERLESDQVDHQTDRRRRRNSITFHDKISNADGQLFNFYWHNSPDDGYHELYLFKIYTAESTKEMPIYFTALTSDNPKDSSLALQKELATKYFSGANPDCE